MSAKATSRRFRTERSAIVDHILDECGDVSKFMQLFYLTRDADVMEMTRIFAGPADVKRMAALVYLNGLEGFDVCPAFERQKSASLRSIGGR